ncbi:Glycoside hydrolase family 71 [Penicillium subrubescens]|uniref:Uncharacterized protein n=1 Tax=Penicillium subrubescens TaxID=1316194 RepID=A0A1Q5T8Q2_9EURO|nr:Glycoside hydrolase family 71 [Penicillium subrubescens]KAJ5912114.1 Glycoside hydrolase family 71 [Penicillium subrubescens]OKO96580.1 hypothetical protein PENSUB_10755 [Penicillium subrubescens]
MPPAQNTSITGWAPDIQDNGLCNFACTRDYCPSPVCLDSTPDDAPCGLDYDSEDCPGDFPCDFSINYSSLDALEADIGMLDPYCVDFYMLSALYGELETTLANYTSIADTTNYDDDFKEYAKYMKEQVQPQLMYFMNISEVIGSPNGVGNRFFECTYNFNGINKSRTACPDEYIGSDQQTHIIYYDIMDREGFFANLTADIGVEPDWVTLDGGLFLGTKEVPYYGTSRPDCNVSDPRDIMKQALPNIPNLQLSIILTLLNIASGGFDGVIDDVVQSIATAVFTLGELVDRIYNVVDIGEKVAAEEKKEKILQIIGGVFMALPFLGPLSGLGDIIEGFDALLALTGTVANEAFDIYTIVQNPESAPVAILSMLLGFDAGGAVGQISEKSLGAFEYDSLAAMRRNMKSDEIKGIRNLFEQKMSRVELLERVLEALSFQGMQLLLVSI